MPKILNDAQREQLTREFDGGAKAKDLAIKFGVTLPTVYDVAKKIRGVLEAKDAMAEEGAPPVVSAPAPVSAAPFSPAQNLPPKPNIPVPLFPSQRPNQFDSIKLTRVVSNPPSAGVGFIGNYDPYMDEATIQGLFGGGRYDIKGYNASGQEIGRRVVTLTGRSRPFLDEFPEEKPLESTAFEFKLPEAMKAAGPASFGDFSVLLKQVQENTRAQIDQMRETSERAILQAREAARDQVDSLKTTMDSTIRQNQMFFENMIKLQQPRKEESLREKLEELRLLKELAGDGDNNQKDSVTAAIENAPAIIKAASDLIHGPEVEYDEDEIMGDEGEEGEEVETAPNPPAVKPIKEIAIELIRNLVSQGVAFEEAKQMVIMGMGMMDQKVKAARALAAPKPAPKAIVRVPPAQKVTAPVAQPRAAVPRKSVAPPAPPAVEEPKAVLPVKRKPGRPPKVPANGAVAKTAANA